MVLNKYRKYVKWKYDGNRIVKIGAKELYHRVYKRVWDLTIYSADILERYGLNKAKYVYVGQSKEIYIANRTAKFKNNIENKHSTNKQLLSFIDCLKRFYKQELKYSESMIDRIIIPEGEVVCRCENKEIALRKEKEITGHYHLLSLFGEILEPRYILLSDRDSYFKFIEELNGTYTLKLRD